MAKAVCPGFSSQLRIDLGVIRANYRALADRAAPARCGAVVKANAYGLGIAKVAPTLHREGCRDFFVAQLCEAFDLLDAIGVGSTIFILNGLDPGGEAACAEWGFVPTLNSESQVARWRALARTREKALPAALQIDSGMSRLGLDPAAAAGLADDPAFAREVKLELVMTHLACADEPDHAANRSQLDRFLDVRRRFPAVPASIANSGGVLLPPRYHLDLVRPGIALFGAPPEGHAAAGLQPVLSLDARVLQIREIAAGDGVGYGLDYVASAPRRLATVGIGYGDGWPRGLGGVGAAWFKGRRLPIVGRVSMDSLTVDITGLPRGAIEEGGFVELIGRSQSLARVAHDAGTIPYEILTRLGTRHQRIYLDGDQAETVAAGAAR